MSIPTTLVKYGAKSIVPWPEPQPTSTASWNCPVVYKELIYTDIIIWDVSQNQKSFEGVSIQL